MKLGNAQVLFIAACVPGAAFAQSHQQEAESYWPGVIMQRMTPAEHEETLRKFGECLIREEPDRVRALLAMPSHGPGVHDAVAALTEAAGECSPMVFWTTDATSVRDALVDVLYARDFHGRGNGRPSVELGPDGGDLEMAKCVVRTAADAADQLTMTGPASKQEKAAFAALEPYVRSCSGELPRTSEERRRARYEITEALYRARSRVSMNGAVK